MENEEEDKIYSLKKTVANMEGELASVKCDVEHLEKKRTNSYDISDKLSAHAQYVIKVSKGPLKPENIMEFFRSAVFDIECEDKLPVIRKYSDDIKGVKTQLLCIKDNIEARKNYMKKQEKLDDDFIEKIEKLNKDIEEEHAKGSKKLNKKKMPLRNLNEQNPSGKELNKNRKAGQFFEDYPEVFVKKENTKDVAKEVCGRKHRIVEDENEVLDQKIGYKQIKREESDKNAGSNETKAIQLQTSTDSGKSIEFLEKNYWALTDQPIERSGYNTDKSEDASECRKPREPDSVKDVTSYYDEEEPMDVDDCEISLFNEKTNSGEKSKNNETTESELIDNALDFSYMDNYTKFG